VGEGGRGWERVDERIDVPLAPLPPSSTLSTLFTLAPALSQLLRLIEVQREVEPRALFELGGHL